MTGAIEEGGKVIGGVVDAMRNQPLAIANIVLNICFLLFLFYYVSRIATRAETTVAAIFAANDRLYDRWGVIVKDTSDLAEKSLHCISVEDALRLMNPNQQRQNFTPLSLPPLKLLKDIVPR
jgi:hypothetical protein